MKEPPQCNRLLWIRSTVQHEGVIYQARKNRITRNVQAWSRNQWCEIVWDYGAITGSFKPK